jgi:hypothetical protein
MFFVFNSRFIDLYLLNVAFYFLAIPLLLSSNPIVFLYVKSLTSADYKFSTRTLTHFIPAAILSLIASVLILSMPSDIRVDFFSGNNHENNHIMTTYLVYMLSTIILFVQAVIYSIFMLKKLYNHNKNVEKFYSSKEKSIPQLA